MKASTLTRQEILDLQKALQNVSKLRGVKFAYGVAQNINTLKPEIEAISKASTPDDDYLEYDKKRADLAKSFAKKDENGNPITTMVNGYSEYDIEDQAAFDAAYNALKDEHKDEIARREEQVVEFEEMLKEKVDMELYEIKLSTVPEDITGEQLSGIYATIVDDTDDLAKTQQ